MAETKLSVQEIKELMSHFASLKLGELKIKDGEFEIKIESKKTELCMMPANGEVLQAQPTFESNAAAEPKAEEADALPSGNVVKSPIVGTYYSSAAPDKPAFVEVGKKVKKGETLFIIESMKLMNEIQSDFTGEVVEILVDNGQAIEYGQPIMIIR